jgi:cardiolipin synthase (CMP-forming)
MLPLKIVQCTWRSTIVSANILRLQYAGSRNSLLIRNFPGCTFFCTEIKKSDLGVKTVKSAEIIQKALHEKKKQLKEKRQQFQDNIKDKRLRVEEVFEEKKKQLQEKKQQIQEKIERENIYTIPNFLCIGRIAMSPYLGYTIISGNYTLSMGLLIAAGLTDFADGYIARKWEGQKSNFGSFLDPLADKTLVATLVVCLSYSELMPLWLTGIILFRDLFLIIAAFVIRYNSLPPTHRTLTKYFDATHVTAQLAPTFISKVNTGVQLFTIAASLGAPIFNYSDHVILHGLWYLTGLTTGLAALSYWTQRKNTYKYLRKN